jgi:hypothetical protein
MRWVSSTDHHFVNPNNDVTLNGAANCLDNDPNDEHAIHAIAYDSLKSKERGFNLQTTSLSKESELKEAADRRWQGSSGP